MRPHPLLLPLILLSACSTGPSLPGGPYQHRTDGLEWSLGDDTSGAFRASVRRSTAIPAGGSVDLGGIEQGCRRDALRIALEEAERRGEGGLKVDERRIESGSGVVPGPYAYCTASIRVSTR